MTPLDQPESRVEKYSRLYKLGKTAWGRARMWPPPSPPTWHQLNAAYLAFQQGNDKFLGLMHADPTFRVMLEMGVRWVADAMPVVELPELVAAALCTSAMAPVAVDELKAPWNCFAIEVPDGLIAVTGIDGEPDPIRLILVSYGSGRDLQDRPIFGWNYLAMAGKVEVRQTMLSHEQLIVDDVALDHPVNSSLPLDGLDDRGMALCRALIRGVVFRCGDPATLPSYKKKLGQSAKAKKARAAKYNGIPDFDRYVITDRIDIDTREAVKRFLLGERASPSVRHLVRGHFRNQVCGPQRQQRKRMWIHPHWRGEEGLPIATKTHRIVAP